MAWAVAALSSPGQMVVDCYALRYPTFESANKGGGVLLMEVTGSDGVQLTIAAAAKRLESPEFVEALEILGSLRNK